MNPSIIPTTQLAMTAACLTGSPAIMEPLLVSANVCSMYSCIARKRGTVFNEEWSPYNLLCNLKAYPVLESFGSTGFLRSQPSGQPSPQMVFSH